MEGQTLVVPIRIRESGREERTSPVKVSVCIELNATSTSRQQQMQFQLTDEADNFFLYTLRVSEEEFQILKSDQSILIDFSDFPSKFMELLHACLTAADDDSPKFSAQLSSMGEGAHLAIVETNNFKNLTHLKLEFRAGNDAAVKKYLAKELEKARGQRDKLQQKLLAQEQREREDRVAAERSLADSRDQLENANGELQKMRLQHATLSAEMREAAAQVQQQLQAQNESDKKNIIKEHTDKASKLSQQVDELRVRGDKLEEQRADLQTLSRELQTKLASAEHELAILRTDLAKQREENKALDRIRHEHEKTIQANAVRLSTLEQQVADGKEMSAQLTLLVESANAQKSSTEEQIRLMRSTNNSLQDKCKAYSAEVSKANSIIEQLQDELKASRTKIKVKSAVVSQQEQVLHEKDKCILERENRCRALEQEVVAKEGQIGITEGKLLQAENKLREAERTLASNQQVISWLNKEVNEAQMTSRGAYGAALSFRPSVPSLTSTPGPISHSFSHTTSASKFNLASADSDHVSRSQMRDPLSAYLASTTPGSHIATDYSQGENAVSASSLRRGDYSFAKTVPHLTPGAVSTTHAKQVEYIPPTGTAK